MNYILHLSGFYDRVLQDGRISPTHISLYMALFQFWNSQHFKKSIAIHRAEIMEVSKIRSVATYHKCMRELHQFGYIIYEPSYNPFAGSLVTMMNTYPVSHPNTEQVQEDVLPSDTKTEYPIERYDSGTSTDFELLNEPYTNIKNNINNKHIDSEHPGSLNFEHGDNFDDDAEKKEKLRQKKKTNIGRLVYPAPQFKIPEPAEVKMYFSEKDQPSEEAEKFFNHYEANGWLVGGRSPMKNWQAAARNWIINTKKYQANPVGYQSRNRPEPRHLNATTEKSYREKL